MIQPPVWAGREQDFCMMCVMQSHIVHALSNSGNVIKPTGVINDLRRIAKHFRLGSQEDAHEFLRYTVDEMQKSCLSGYISCGRNTQTTTFIHQVFGGCLRSRVKCFKCKSVSDTYEDCLDIALEIKASNSINQALEEFVKAEQLEGDNAYKCSKCNQLVTATKKFTIHRTSNVLTLSLKRFASFSGGKLSKEIKYPEYLDIRPYTSHSSGEALIYKLYAVLVHSGFSCHNGHYYSYIKASNDQWYLMNDSIVSNADIRTVLNQQAYLLFYIRSQHFQNGDTAYTVQSSSPNSPQPSCSQRAGVSKFSFIGPQQIIKNVKHVNGNRSPKSSVNGAVLNNNCASVKRPLVAGPVNRQVSINSAAKKQKITITINKQHPALQGPSIHAKAESTTSSNLTSPATKLCPAASTSSIYTQSELKHAPVKLNRGNLVNGKSKMTPNVLVPYGTESSEESEEEPKGIRKRRWSGKGADGTVLTNGHSTHSESPDWTVNTKEEEAAEAPIDNGLSPQNELSNHDSYEPIMTNSHNGENHVGTQFSVDGGESAHDAEALTVKADEDDTTAASPRIAFENGVSEPRPPSLTAENVGTKPEISQVVQNGLRYSDSEDVLEIKPLPPSSGCSEDHKRNGDRRSPSFDRSRYDRYRPSDGREYRHRDYSSNGHYKHRDYDRQRSRSRGREGDRYYYHSKKDRSRSRERHRKHYSPYRDHRGYYDRDYRARDYKSGWFHHNRGHDRGYGFKYNNHHSSFYSRYPDSYHNRKFKGYSNYHNDYGRKRYHEKYHHEDSSDEDDYDHGSKHQANHRTAQDWIGDR